MNFHGRQLDPLALWGNYVEFTPNQANDDEFADKVVCPNPSHDTLKSHFQINLRQPTVHCFAMCGISGSYEHAIATIEGLYEKFDVAGGPNERERKRRTARALREARKIILRAAAGRSKISGKPRAQRNTRPAKAVSSGALRYDTFLPPLALEYLDARGITSASVSAWQIGWLADERRIVIPGRDENGHLKFLIKRAVRPQDRPKYLYTEGFPKTSLLFGTGQINLPMISSHGLILVEGSLGAILNHQHGLKNTAAILGTGISREQTRIIARINPPKIYLFFDRDAAGVANIEIAAGALRKYPLYVVRYPKGKQDADDMTGEEKHRQISRAVPAAKFIREHGLNVKRKERKSFA